MKKLPFINLLVVSTLVLALASVSHVSATQEVDSLPLQSGVTLAATGTLIMPDTSPDPFTWSFDFDPAGGPVSGNFKVVQSASGGIFTYTFTLTGNFEGGDGGRVNGNCSTHLVVTGTSNPGSMDDSATWEGHLYANGTGKGTLGSNNNANWTVTFSADEFQAAFLPTATPMSFSVVGKEVHLSQEVRNNIAASPLLDDATKALLNQDSVLIVRDANDQFYAINNQKKAIPLPDALRRIYEVNEVLGILGNNSLLNKAGYGDMRDDINGGSQADSLKKIPDDLKNHDYTSLTTTCSTTAQCRPEMRTNSTASSMHISLEGVGLESDTAIRGTINGGGDFIYLPRPAGNTELISLSIGTGRAIQDSGNQPYIGVQVEDGSSGAIINMIQKTSPAEQAGLAIGDTVTSVSGTHLDTQNTLAALIGQHAGGDQVELGIIRNGNPQSVTVTLAQLLPPIIFTPSAEITGPNDTELVVDIGFNGVTGVLVLADTAHVREPVTGSEVDVPAGSVVIVVPGYEIGNPIQVNASDVTAWWNGEQQPTPVPPVPGPGPSPTPVDSTWLYIILAGCCCVIVIAIVVVVVIVLVTRKKKQSLAPTSYPPQR